ncbi:hypothetical protein PSHT_10816 [Puccinia striiformis]|uniref:DSBA-like thioredoxin domain-containing protein n=2 Tax=Puccinia striiformis TaxID=27350 RepID=A0A2S4V787_9BASI|nr:hypothetical protein PSHT_10816 [Puccinia striiformis]
MINVQVFGSTKEGTWLIKHCKILVKFMVLLGPFPFNTLLIMRSLQVNKVSVSKDLSEVCKSLLPDPTEAKKLEEYFMMKKQRRVKQEAERVVEEGGFSFPWLKITQPNGQLLTIFGSDRLEFLANWLGKEWKGPNTSVSNPQESRL